MLSKNKKQIGLTALSVLLLMVLVSLIPLGNSICFLDKEGKPLMKMPLNRGNEFEVAFRHSVNKGMVIERYRISYPDQTIYLTSGWFENYGAGMMDTLGEGMKMTEDSNMLRIDFPMNKTKEVTFFAAGIANHKFHYDEWTISLFQKWPHQPITIAVKKMNLIEYVNFRLGYVKS